MKREAEVTVDETSHGVLYSFSKGASDKRYLIDPGVEALVGSNELKGIYVDLSPFVMPRSSPKER
ncbi:hypothetical protein U91I_00436 [alpha proteobacterium U9-1i]|nr:hypothetical protein U91I_00436 [alpha proteobacterium U9-1i]